MYCNHCGKELRDDMVYCGYCGQRVWSEETVRQLLNGQNVLPTASSKLSTPQVVASIPNRQSPQELWQSTMQQPLRPQPDTSVAASPLQQDRTARIARTIVAVMTTIMSLFILVMHFSPLYEVSFFDKKRMSVLSLISRTNQLLDRVSAFGVNVSEKKALLIISMILIIVFMLVIVVFSALVLIWLATDRPYTIRLFVPVIVSMLLSFAVQLAVRFYIEDLSMELYAEALINATSAGFAYALSSILFPILIGLSAPKACVKKRKVLLNQA